MFSVRLHRVTLIEAHLRGAAMGQSMRRAMLAAAAVLGVIAATAGRAPAGTIVHFSY